MSRPRLDAEQKKVSFSLAFSPNLIAALENVRGARSQSVFVEEWLRQHPQIAAELAAMNDPGFAPPVARYEQLMQYLRRFTHLEMAGSHPFHVPSSLRTRLSYAIVKVRDRKFRSRSLLPWRSSGCRNVASMGNALPAVRVLRSFCQTSRIMLASTIRSSFWKGHRASASNCNTISPASCVGVRRCIESD